MARVEHEIARRVPEQVRVEVAQQRDVRARRARPRTARRRRRHALQRAARAPQPDPRPGRQIAGRRGTVRREIATAEQRQRLLLGERVLHRGRRRRRGRAAEPVLEQRHTSGSRPPTSGGTRQTTPRMAAYASEVRGGLAAGVDRRPRREHGARLRPLRGEDLAQLPERALAAFVVKAERQPSWASARGEDRPQQADEPARVLGGDEVQRAAQRPRPDERAVAQRRVDVRGDDGARTARAEREPGEGELLRLDARRAVARRRRRPRSAGPSVPARAVAARVSGVRPSWRLDTRPRAT